MPNGFHGPKEEWDQIEAPLREIDESLCAFAKQNSLRLSKNYHNWPERSLMWSDGSVHKLIQIYLSDEKTMAFSVWLCAHRDKQGGRHWKQASLRSSVPFSDIKNNLLSLLAEGLKTLKSWNDADLEAVKNK